MPAKIPLSAVKALDFEFDGAVAAYKQALADWSARPADWAPVPVPMPPHPLVAIAAGTDVYEIFDDTPPPPAPPTLEQRKATLANQIEMRAAAAIERLIPPLKRRLIDLQLKDALQTPEKERSQAQRDAINNRRGVEEQIGTINLKVAQMLDRIHDMDEEAFEAFTMMPQPAID